MEISNIDISILLNMVDTFYNNAWNRLTIILIVIGGIGGIVGVAWPILLKKFSDYHAKIEVDKVENNLREQFQNLSNGNVKLIEKEMNKFSEAIDKVISKKFEDTEKKICFAQGVNWHTIGNLMGEKKYTKLALEYYFAAFDEYFNGKHEGNMQKIIYAIKTQYGNIDNLLLYNEIKVKHLELIKKLKEINENSRY